MPYHGRMKTVLCFGDSNTWGRSPHSTARHPPESRWPNVMARELGPDVTVIAEGLNGRTTVWDDPIEEHRSGKAYLPACLLSHHPLELVVLMLGTNDLKKRFSVSPFDIGRSVGLLLDMMLKSGTGPGGAAPKVLLVAPPPLGKLSAFAEMFEGAHEKCAGLPARYREHAELRGCEFFDAGSVVKASDADGIHLDAADQVKLGAALTPIVRGLLAA